MKECVLIRQLIPNITQLEDTYQFQTDDSAYDDEILKLYYRHCKFLSDYQPRIINESGITMKEILYSLYYWGHRFIERSNAISLSDAGFEQWHFSLIEKIESSCGAVDFTLLEKIDKNEVQL
jgi:hypothetical protein